MDTGGATLRPRARSPFALGRRYTSLEIESLVERDYDVNVLRYLREGWELFDRYKGGFAGFSILCFVVTIALVNMRPFGTVLDLFLAAPLTAGQYFVALELARDREPEFSHFFRGFDFLFALMLAGVWIIGSVMAASVFLIVPGIYLLVGYAFTLLLIVDKDMYYWQAMQVSRRIVGRRWGSIFLLGALLVPLNMAGASMLLIGLTVTFPVSVCVTVAAYNDIVGVREAPVSRMKKGGAKVSPTRAPRARATGGEVAPSARRLSPQRAREGGKVARTVRPDTPLRPLGGDR